MSLRCRDETVRRSEISGWSGVWLSGCLLIFLVVGASASQAGEVDVVAAKGSCNASSVCRFKVTLRHADTGWEHYTNRYEILGESDEVLATRVLRHPHVNEQPFTRALEGVALPPNLDGVKVRAHDLVHEYGGAEQKVRLERPAEAKGVAGDLKREPAAEPRKTRD